MGLFITHSLHLLAAVSWIGGLVYINLVLFPSIPAINMTARGRLMLRAIPRFLKLVWLSVGLILVSALHRIFAVQKMTTIESWTGSGYGHILMTKTLLFLLVVGIAAHLTFIRFPKIKHHIDTEHQNRDIPDNCPVCGKLMKQSRRILQIALILGILIIILAAKLRVG